MNLSTNRLYKNQTFYVKLQGMESPQLATRSVYESGKAIYDINYLQINGYCWYSKNCRFLTDKYSEIPNDDKPYYDFIEANTI